MADSCAIVPFFLTNEVSFSETAKAIKYIANFEHILPGYGLGLKFSLLEI